MEKDLVISIQHYNLAFQYITTMKKKTDNKGQNFILVQMKREDGTTITTFNGEPHHVELLKEYITDVFYNEGGGMTIWIEILAGKM